MEIPENDPSEVLKNIGKRVRKLRLEKYSNYEAFAKESGINKVTILRIEKGEDFRMSNLVRILLALDGNFDDIFNS